MQVKDTGKKKKPEKPIKVRNILADGREVKDMTGYTVPETCRVYKLLGEGGLFKE